jgi:hypothetical protein
MLQVHELNTRFLNAGLCGGMAVNPIWTSLSFSILGDKRQLPKKSNTVSASVGG